MKKIFCVLLILSFLAPALCPWKVYAEPEISAPGAVLMEMSTGEILYEKNADELLSKPDVDGGLIGGASLKPDQFVDIINAANQED